MEQFIPFKNYLEQQIDEIEEELDEGGGGGGDVDFSNVSEPVISVEATDGFLSLIASNPTGGAITLNSALGYLIQGGPSSALNLMLDGGNETLVWQPGQFEVTVDAQNSQSTLRIEPDNVLLLSGADDSQVTIQANGNGTTNVSIVSGGATAGNITLDCDGLGFYGGGPTPKPVVPATPTIQDVVDALVSLGLISQA
jgi:hypothetical protein